MVELNFKFLNTNIWKWQENVLTLQRRKKHQHLPFIITIIMKFTIIKNSKENSHKIYQTYDFNTLKDCILHNSQDKLTSEYREIFLALETPDSWHSYNRMAQLCPVTEYYRNMAKERVFRAYNGVSVLTIEGLNGSLEVEKAKKQAAVMPQVMAAFCGANGHSVVILTCASLSDGTLPKNEEDALAFCTHAYVLSVQCLQPHLEFPITLKEPALDDSFLVTNDANPYFNDHVVPFIIDTTSSYSLKSLNYDVPNQKLISKLSPGREACLTYSKVFNAAYSRALEELGNLYSNNLDVEIICTAEHCALVGLPEEETVMRLHMHYRKHDIDEIRGTVRNIYKKAAEKERIGSSSAMYKHQMVAYQLREFLERRYEIRFNEVLQMTEFRERRSLKFLFRELNRRELNAIHHEALLEGIEPTFGEVDELVHSTLIKTFNPIEDFLRNLPKWDGNDYISQMADRVTTDNPYWHRLFRQWFLSMVAHWMNGNEQHANSTAPILIGKQGYRKSTFCRQLLPPELQIFYTDSIDFRSNTEAERCLSRFMLVNIDEFDQLNDKQFAFVKHLFQKPVSNIRRMYSEAIGTQRRYASFIGTTNVEEILRDPTGNRRYLCVMVTEPIQTGTPVNYSQLYAQAVHLINNGERYWLDDEDEALIRETNTRFEVEEPLEMMFHSTFDTAEDEEEGKTEWLRTTDIMEALTKHPAFNSRTDKNVRKLGKVLTKLNLKKRNHKSGTQYLVNRIQR